MDCISPAYDADGSTLYAIWGSDWRHRCAVELSADFLLLYWVLILSNFPVFFFLSHLVRSVCLLPFEKQNSHFIHRMLSVVLSMSLMLCVFFYCRQCKLYSFGKLYVPRNDDVSNPHRASSITSHSSIVAKYFWFFFCLFSKNSKIYVVFNLVPCEKSKFEWTSYELESEIATKPHFS